MLLIMAKGWEFRPEAVGHCKRSAQRGEIDQLVVRRGFAQHFVRDLGDRLHIRKQARGGRWGPRGELV